MQPVSAALGDYLMLDAIRASGGTAVAVSDAAMIADMRALAVEEGISAAPEGAATLAALRVLLAGGCYAVTSASCCSTPAQHGSTPSWCPCRYLPVLDPDDPRALEDVATVT